MPISVNQCTTVTVHSAKFTIWRDTDQMCIRDSIMGVVLVALVIIIVVMVVIHRRKEIKKDSKAELQDDIQETPRRARHSRTHE